MTAHAYSFLDVKASIVGPGGTFQLGAGAGVADEGITIEPTEDVGTMATGADGQGMHSLHAARPGRATIRLLKTSPVNKQLSLLFSLQTTSSSLYGQNIITVSDVARGDLAVCQQAAFAKHAPITWAKDANFNEWVFNVPNISWLLGDGN